MSSDEADPEDVEQAIEGAETEDLETPHANQPTDVFEYSIIENPNDADRIMLTPGDAEGEEFLTQWISAREDAAIELEEVR